MGACISRDITRYSDNEQDKIIRIFSSEINDNIQSCRIDEYYNWNGRGYIKIDAAFIEKCLQYKNIRKPYIIKKKNGYYKIYFISMPSWVPTQ